MFIAGDSAVNEVLYQDQLVPNLSLKTNLKPCLEEDTLHTPIFDLEKSSILCDFGDFGDFETVAFPALDDMNPGFMSGLNPSPVTTSTTDPSKTNPSTTVAAVGHPVMSPRTDEDIPSMYEEPVTIKIENIDLGYEKTSSPHSDVSSLTNSSHSNEFGDTDMDLDKNKQEVIDACRMLAIPTDPYNPYTWTIEHVQRWARWTLEQYNLPITHVDDFIIDGGTLCNLSAAEFQSLSPKVGEYLFAQLEFWKSVYIITSVDARSVSGSPASHHSHDVTMSPQPSTSSYPTTVSPVYHDMDQQAVGSHQPLPSCSTHQPIVIAPISSGGALPFDLPKSCIAPITMTSMMSTSGPMETFHGSFAIKQEPMPSGSGIGPLPSIGTIRGMSPASSRSSPALSQVGPATPPQRQPLPKLTQTKHNIHLWQFLRELLLRPETYSNCIRWLDRSKGIFKIEDSVRVARLWGQRKNRPAMNYDKLSRSIRQYYKKGIIKKTDNSKRLVYQFCPPYRA